MAKLCAGCKDKKPDTSVRGTCTAPSATPVLPPTHMPWTESPNLGLCDGCAEHFQLCAWCLGPIDGWGVISVPTNKQFCVQSAQNDGGHVAGMYVGEQILAKMVVDLFSGKQWRLKSASPGVRLAHQRLVAAGGQYAWQELYIDLDRANPKAEIELEEAYAGRWWGPPQTGSNTTWKITVEVKQ
jgi:hypothetical protein